PVEPRRSRFARRELRRRLRELRVPGARLTERNRERGAVAVDDVLPEQQWNVQPRLLDRDLLHVARRVGAIEVQESADETATHQIRLGWVRAGIPGWQIQLAQLLRERHLRDEGGDAFLDQSLGGERWGTADNADDRKDQERCAHGLSLQ